MTREIPGAHTESTPYAVEEFDQLLSATAGSALLQQLRADAFGQEFTGLETWSNTTWWLLGRLVAGLRIGPGERLGDLACGLGEPGLWLARATGADLVGVDWSPVAVAAASSKVGGFVPPGRARFAVGTLEATGLDDGELDAAMCLDAIFFATDRIAVLREVRRVLRPGGRFQFTADELARPELPHPGPDWARLVEAAGFEVEVKELVPGYASGWQRLYALWLEHVDQIRALHGEFSAALMEQEASEVGPTMDERSGVVITCRRD
jgi:ubiquinone/menaquinone biosynthesis C-methylase UbiE